MKFIKGIKKHHYSYLTHVEIKIKNTHVFSVDHFDHQLNYIGHFSKTLSKNISTIVCETYIKISAFDKHLSAT